MKLLLHALLLTAGGALLGLGGNRLTPRPAPLGTAVLASAETPGAMCQLPGGLPPLIPRIAVAQAAPLCLACSALFVDARSAGEFAAGHVSGAVHLAPGEPPELVLSRLAPGQPVIVYDRDPGCALADEVAKALLDRGVKDVRVLTGAWPAWSAAGAPGSSGPCALCDDGGARSSR